MESELLQHTADNSWTPRLSDSGSLALTETFQFSDSASDVKTTGENIITHRKPKDTTAAHQLFRLDL